MKEEKLDLNQLLAFERIARERSFSRAAWELGIAQPTISARIRGLERELGMPLFTRAGRRVGLTDAGASFLPYARRVLDILREGTEAARQTQAGGRGRMTIGVLESLSGHFLAPPLAQFRAVAPGVEVVVRAGRHEIMLELLRDGIIGLALIAWPCSDELDVPLRVLFALRERVVLVAAPGHPLGRQRSVTQAQLLVYAQPLLLLRWWRTLDPTIAALVQHSTNVIDVPMETARQLVLSGTGTGFFTWMQVADALAAGELIEVTVTDQPPIVRESALVHLQRSAPLSMAAQTMIALLRERAAQLGLLASAQQTRT